MAEMIVRLKHGFVRFATPLSVIVGVALIISVALVADSLDWKIVITAISVVLSLIYFMQRQKLEELRLFKDLFEAFNERYDGMNERLARIADRDSGGALTPDEKEALVDYFNLCGEEYLYYRLGYIYPEVWRAWHRGMRYYYSKPHIQDVWAEELDTQSYYGLRRELLDQGRRTANPIRVGVAASGPNSR